MAEQRPDRTLTRGELANKLEETVAWTHRHLAALMRNEDFPPPFLPNRWSEIAVDDWIAWRSSRSPLRFHDWLAQRELQRAARQGEIQAAPTGAPGARLAQAARELARGG